VADVDEPLRAALRVILPKPGVSDRGGDRWMLRLART